MSHPEVVPLIKALSWEIKQLRRICDETVPKAEAYEVIRTIVKSLSRQGGAMGEDILQRAEEVLKELSESRSTSSKKAR